MVFGFGFGNDDEVFGGQRGRFVTWRLRSSAMRSMRIFLRPTAL
jgi:hypothetical protein